MKLYVTRHAQSEANAKIKKGGNHKNSNLTEIGEEQAKMVALRLKEHKFDAVYSSDLIRAKRTAEAINEYHGHEILEDVRLREYDFGTIGGMDNYRAFINKQIKDRGILQEDIKMPNGESEAEHRERVREFLEEAIEKHKGENILIVAHGMTNRFIHSVLLDLSFKEARDISQANTCVNEFEFKEGKWICNLNNCSLHLPIPKDLLEVFVEVREEPFMMPEEVDGYDGRCYPKHRRLKEKLEALGYKTRFRAARFSWSRQKIPKDVANLALSKEVNHLYLQVKIYGKWINVDCTYDSRMPTFNEFNGREHTKIAVLYDEILSIEEGEKIEENERERFVKEFGLWKEFYCAMNKYLEDKKNEI